MNVLIIGPSGSGKDTQSDLLEKDFGFTMISTGALLRKEVDKETMLGKEIEKYLDEGKWVPTEITYKLLEKEYLEITSENIIFNGVVRYPEQVNLLDNLLEKKGETLDSVLLLNLDNETAVKRLTARGREDDEKDLIISRLNEFKESFDPILNSYKQRDILIDIDASKTIEEVHLEIVNKLNL
ncbi:nucleoside monophosphate kinase [Candidatus Dojkabacteria bacterium]|uniref:Adenylate kinase n=1 Tax=Candidatus Dojkabacteria bacterium TaxID=2099670 RepID=A0A955IBB2_9BACT|nr:nucleoside monophosphate kinase [Candidatus Dojkabacteria bacterium]